MSGGRFQACIKLHSRPIVASCVEMQLIEIQDIKYAWLEDIAYELIVSHVFGTVRILREGFMGGLDAMYLASLKAFKHPTMKATHQN
jgi:hypothetical protein